VVVSWRRPADLAEAVRLVAGGGTPVGGGAALLSPALLPQLGEIAVDLDGLLPVGVDGTSVGAGTTLAQLAAHPVVRARWPALAAAAGAAATPQVRADPAQTWRKVRGQAIKDFLVWPMLSGPSFRHTTLPRYRDRSRPRGT